MCMIVLRARESEQINGAPFAQLDAADGFIWTLSASGGCK